MSVARLEPDLLSPRKGIFYCNDHVQCVFPLPQLTGIKYSREQCQKEIFELS